MKQYKEDHRLKTMAVPAVRASQHQAALRSVLVSRAAQRTVPKITIRGAIHMSKQTFFAGTGAAALVAIAVIAFTVAAPSSVSALQVAQNSAQALAAMTSQEAEYKKFYPYFVGWLQQAQKAPDLRLLSYDEVVKAYPEEMGVKESVINEPLRVIDDPSDGTAPDLHSLKYLEFTARYDDGFDTTVKVVVGVNTNNIPEAAFTHFISGKITPRIGG